MHATSSFCYPADSCKSAAPSSAAAFRSITMLLACFKRRRQISSRFAAFASFSASICSTASLACFKRRRAASATRRQLQKRRAEFGRCLSLHHDALGTFQGLALASDELNARSITHILLGFHRQHCTTHTLRIASGIPFKALRTARRVQLLLSAPSRRSWHVSRSGVGVR